MYRTRVGVHVLMWTWGSETTEHSCFCPSSFMWLLTRSMQHTPLPTKPPYRTKLNSLVHLSQFSEKQHAYSISADWSVTNRKALMMSCEQNSDTFHKRPSFSGKDIQMNQVLRSEAFGRHFLKNAVSSFEWRKKFAANDEMWAPIMKSTISRDSQQLISSQLPKSRWIRTAAVWMDVFLSHALPTLTDRI